MLSPLPSSALAVAALALAACHPRIGPAEVRAPRGDEAELAVYLQPIEDTTLAIELAAAEAIRADGTAVPLVLGVSRISTATAGRQRLLAHGRVPAGDYSGLRVGVKRATFSGSGPRASDLALPDEPLRLPVPFAAPRDRGVVLDVVLRPDRAVGSGALFQPSAFAAFRPDRPAAPLLGLSAVDGSDALAVFDRRAHRVVGLLPTSPAPRGIAIDRARQVAYASSARGDRIQAFDLVTFDELQETLLRPGDRAATVALTPDGTVLIVANPGSDSVTFVDPVAGQVLERLSVQGEPMYLVLDRPGLRAFVVSRLTAAVTILDVQAQAIVRTVPVEAEPVRLEVSPAGDRLTVAYARAPFLTVYSLPDGTPLGRIYTGVGVSALLRDPRSNILYVATNEARLQLFDPGTLLSVGTIDLPAAASYLAIDDAEEALLAVLPSRGSVAVIDLVSRQLRAEIEVGTGPHELALVSAERR